MLLPRDIHFIYLYPNNAYYRRIVVLLYEEIAMPFVIGSLIIGGFALGGSIYAADQAKKQANKARSEARAQTAAMSVQAAKQLSVQQEQAKVARERLNFEIGQSSESRSRVEQETARTAQQLEEQQRIMAEEESNRMRQLRRGGFRSLLSQERVNPEAGLGSFGSSTLGSGTGLR
jgi:hypothetical protein